MVFETARLSVRHFAWTDLNFLAGMQGNANVMRHVTGRPKSFEETAAEMRRIISAYGLPDEGFSVMAVAEKPCGELIGACAVIGNEIGYRLDEPHWGRGYGRELFTGLLDYCFRIRGLAWVTADAEEANLASVRILDPVMRLVSSGPDPDTGKIVRQYRLENLFRQVSH